MIITLVRAQVSWLRRAEDGMRLLSYDRQVYISDGRYQLEFREPNDWQLRIRYANERDQGHYECQVSSHPPLVSRVYLKIQGLYPDSVSARKTRTRIPHRRSLLDPRRTSN